MPRRLLAVLFGVLPLAGCSCSGQPASDGRGPDVRRRDVVSLDRAPPDAPVDRAVRELAGDITMPDPDLNLALCKDATGPLADVAPAAPLPVTPEIKWKTFLSVPGPAGMVRFVARGDDGNFYLSSSAKGIQAVSPAGKLLWTLPLPPGAMHIEPLMPLGDRLFFGSSLGQVHGITTEPSVVFSAPLAGPFNPLSYGQTTSSPARAAQVGTFYIGGSDSYLYTFSTAGLVKGTKIAGSPLQNLMVGETGTIYAAVFPYNKIVALTPSGSQIWSRSLPNAVLATALTATGDLVAAVNTSYTPPYTSDIVKLDRACGAERWRKNIYGSVMFPLVVDVDGTVYFQNSGMKQQYDQLVAVSVSGSIKWATPIEDSGVLGNFSLHNVGPIGADGTIYTVIVNTGPTGNTAGPSHIRAYSRAGKALWDVPVPGLAIDSLAGQPILTSDGLLVFGGKFDESGIEKLYLVAVQTPSPGLAKSAWPRALHDNQNSSNLATPP